MRLTQLRPCAGVLSAAVAVVILSGCSDSGDAAANERLTADQAGYRAVSEQFATAMSEKDAATVCGLFTQTDQADVARSAGGGDCATAVGGLLEQIPADVLTSWGSVDFSTAEIEETDEFCFDRSDPVPVGEGAWAAEGRQALTFPCMTHNGEAWFIDSSNWVMDFEGMAS